MEFVREIKVRNCTCGNMFYFLGWKHNCPTQLANSKTKKEISGYQWTKICVDFVCHGRNALVLFLTLVFPLSPQSSLNTRT